MYLRISIRIPKIRIHNNKWRYYNDILLKVRNIFCLRIFWMDRFMCKITYWEYYIMVLFVFVLL